jgi:hypothetical protein
MAQVGFHDTGPDSVCTASSHTARRLTGIKIGEDMHMFLKCLFVTRGNLISETIYSPASQLDVVGKMAGGIRGYGSNLTARYRQALRHMWGSREYDSSLDVALSDRFSIPSGYGLSASKVVRRQDRHTVTSRS